MPAAPLENFIQVVGVLITLSAASERLVEVLKGYWPWLGQDRVGERDNARRKSHVITVTVLVNLLTTWLAWPLVSQTPAIAALSSTPATMVGLALLASGGSSAWNSVLSYLLGMKEVKKAEAKVAKLEASESDVKARSGAASVARELETLGLTGRAGATLR